MTSTTYVSVRQLSKELGLEVADLKLVLRDRGYQTSLQRLNGLTHRTRSVPLHVADKLREAPPTAAARQIRGGWRHPQSVLDRLALLEWMEDQGCLTTELLASVPSQLYWSTRHWFVFRDQAKAHYRCCSTCESTDQLHVVHRPDFDWARRGQETMDDVLVVCAQCRAQLRGRPQLAGDL